MKIIINNSSMTPIYEQVVEQIKAMILSEELEEGDILPSVRSLSKELKISALTVKKAYDNLEAEGFAVTVHGKGTYVAGLNRALAMEEHKKEIEADLDKAIQKAEAAGWRTATCWNCSICYWRNEYAETAKCCEKLRCLFSALLAGAEKRTDQCADRAKWCW